MEYRIHLPVVQAAAADCANRAARGAVRLAPIRPTSCPSDRVQDAVGFEDSQSLGKWHAAMETPPFAGMPHPVDIEPVRPDTVNAGERRIELLAEIVRHTRSIALHETISPRSPSTMDIDHIVPFSGTDLREKTRFQHVANEILARRDDRAFLSFRRPRRPKRASWLRPLFLSNHVLNPL